jgi:hypothetical protein
LNSGTKFDAVLSATQETPTQGVRFSPNPVSQVSFATIGDDTAVRTEVFDVQGKRVFLDESAQSEVVAVSTANFSKGIFFVKITGEKAIYTAKMVKE